MLEELGESYESISKDPRQGETLTPDMMALNPNGHVPILQDGDHTM
jgi:glutathione S-transferase